jgi:hypothetical protein
MIQAASSQADNNRDDDAQRNQEQETFHSHLPHSDLCDLFGNALPLRRPRENPIVIDNCASNATQA